MFILMEKIGITTSGTHCPYLKQVALAIVDVAHKDVGTKVQVDVRGRMVEVTIKLPF